MYDDFIQVSVVDFELMLAFVSDLNTFLMSVTYQIGIQAATTGARAGLLFQSRPMRCGAAGTRVHSCASICQDGTRNNKKNY